MSVTIPATATPSAAGVASAIVVKAASGATEATANANFKVNPKITMTIPVNARRPRAPRSERRYVDGWFGPTFGTAPAPLTTQTGNPITVVVKNADSVAHIVHGNAGFVHGDTGNPVPPGGTDPKNRTSLRASTPAAICTTVRTARASRSGSASPPRPDRDGASPAPTSLVADAHDRELGLAARLPEDDRVADLALQ